MKTVLALLAAAATVAALDAAAQVPAAKPPANPAAKSPPAAAGSHYGKVKSFTDAKGWGLITPDKGGPDLFVYFTAIKVNGFQTLKPGQRVSYDVLTSVKGNQAVNVHVLP